MKHHSREYVMIFFVLLPTLLGVQAPLLSGPGRRPFYWYVTWRSSCHTHGKWLTIQRKTQHPDSSWQVLTTSGSSNLLLLLSESHQHWIISTFGIQYQGFPPTPALWMEPRWDHLNRPDVTGCLPLCLLRLWWYNLYPRWCMHDVLRSNNSSTLDLTTVWHVGCTAGEKWS